MKCGLIFFSLQYTFEQDFYSLSKTCLLNQKSPDFSALLANSWVAWVVQWEAREGMKQKHQNKLSTAGDRKHEHSN